MAWLLDDAVLEPGTLTAVPKMIAANTLAEFRSIQTSNALRIGGDIA